MAKRSTITEDRLRQIGKSIWIAGLMRDKLAGAASRGEPTNIEAVRTLATALDDIIAGFNLLPDKASEVISDEWARQNVLVEVDTVLDRAKRRARPRTEEDKWRISKDML